MILKRYLTGKSGVTMLVISALVTAGCLLGLALIGQSYRVPLLVFDIRTEFFAQTVVRPDLSALTVRDADIRGLANCAASAAGYSGVVEAPAGATMSYHWRPDRVSVLLSAADGGVRLIGADGSVCADSSPAVAVVFATAGENEPLPMLPIAGPVQIGSELATAVPPPDGLPRRLDLLLEGSFTVFGRTIWPWGAPGLYPIASDSLPIPTGSRIGSIGGQGDRDAWYGVAMPTRSGLIIRATAESDQVQLYRPGAFSDVVTYSFGPLSAIVGDPAIGWLSLLLFIGITAVQLVAAWMGLWVDDDRAERWRRWRRLRR